MRETKSGLQFEIKDADKGEVEAVFATLGVVDSDGDVTTTGAFEDGAEVLISAYGHKSWMGLLPVGKGLIGEEGKEAVFKGNFWLDTINGLDTFKTVKNTGSLQEWSYGYDPTKWSYGEHEGKRVRFLEQIKTYEVSPVLLGAGVGTHTRGMKESVRFADEAASVLADVQALSARAADVMAKRAEKGKALGAESTELLDQLHGELKKLDELLRADPDEADEDAQHELLRFLARQF